MASIEGLGLHRRRRAGDGVAGGVGVDAEAEVEWLKWFGEHVCPVLIAAWMCYATGYNHGLREKAK